jgi:hypothetical protein
MEEEMRIGDLPPEVFLHALSFVEPADLGRAEAVNREWHQLVANDEPTWRTVFASFFAVSGPSPGTPPLYIILLNINNILKFIFVNIYIC